MHFVLKLKIKNNIRGSNVIKCIIKKLGLSFCKIFFKPKKLVMKITKKENLLLNLPYFGK